jgi:hypothetical protein
MAQLGSALTNLLVAQLMEDVVVAVVDGAAVNNLH